MDIKNNKNKNLLIARKNKNDEFYTSLEAIENELKFYKKYFKNKTIFLNCDDPLNSNFWKYFEMNFEHLSLKKLISTHFEVSKKSYKLEITKYKQKPTKTTLMQNGDFRSPECIEILKKSDIIITNPPFSLFREYVNQLIKNKKKFLIIGPIGAIIYKEIFPLIKKNMVWLGINNFDNSRFIMPDSYDVTKSKYAYIDENGNKVGRVSGLRWYTNLEHNRRTNERIILYEKYNKMKFPKYDNYDAINVNKVSEIPIDYQGTIGVPITFLDKYNPEQFEIINLDRYMGNRDAKLNGKDIFRRIFIKAI